MHSPILLRNCILSIAASLGILSSPLAHSQPPELVDGVEVVYRFDLRPPDQVFASGFTATGSQRSLLAHVLDGACEATSPTERSAWVSTSAGIQAAGRFFDIQLGYGPPLVGGVPGMWLYTVRRDMSYLPVEFFWNRAEQLARQSTGGYSYWQADVLANASARSTLTWSQEVVTPRIAPENILHARFYTRAGLQQHVNNPGFNPQSNQDLEYLANTNELIPPNEIVLYQPSRRRPMPSCLMVCDGVSSAKRPRPDRSAEESDGLQCALTTWAPQVFISTED